MDEIKTTIAGQLRQLQMLMHRTMLHRFGKMHDPHRGQGRVLAILRLKPEISQRELTYLLNMSKQAVAELVAKLEKSGYITREPAEDDKRAMTVRLTEEGTKAACNTDEGEPDALEVLDCLDGDELSALSGYLGRIIGRYEAQFPDGDFEERRRYMEQFMSSHGHGHEGCPHAGHGFGGHGHGARHFKPHGAEHGAGHGHCQGGAGRFKKGGPGHDGDGE